MNFFDSEVLISLVVMSEEGLRITVKPMPEKLVYF